MALCNQTTVLAAVRDFLDQIVYSNTEALDEEALLSGGASRFSDMQIATWIDSACRYMGANVKSTYLDEWMEEVVPPNFPGLPVRLAEGSVNVNDVSAVRRSYSANRRLVASLRAPTDAYPAYSFSDYEWTVFGTTENPPGSTGEFVTLPTHELKTNSYTSAGGASLTLTNGSADLFNLVKDAGAFLQLTSDVVIITPFSPTTGTVTPFPAAGSGIVTWYRPAINSMDLRLQGAIVARTAELIFGASERLELAQMAERILARELATYQLNFSAGTQR